MNDVSVPEAAVQRVARGLNQIEVGGRTEEALLGQVGAGVQQGVRQHATRGHFVLCHVISFANGAQVNLSRDTVVAALDQVVLRPQLTAVVAGRGGEVITE